MVIDLNEDTLEHINRFASHGVKTESIFKDDLRKIHLELINMKEVLKKEVKNVERKRLEGLLVTSGIEKEDDKSIVQVYEEALAVTKYGYKINHKKDIDECFVNN